MITITINTDNAAFEDDTYAEVSRILSELAKQIDFQGGIESSSIRDYNGNTVGSIKED